MTSQLPIAVLCPHVKIGMEYLQDTYGTNEKLLVSHTRNGVYRKMQDGVHKLIAKAVTHEEQIYGMPLRGFVVVGRVDRKLIDYAYMGVRVP